LRKGRAAVLVLLLLLTGCAGVEDRRGQVLTERPAYPEPRPPSGTKKCTLYDKGMASWYGNELLGNKTANGERFVPDGITAAHKTLPFGTIVKVTLDNGKGNPEGVYVRINDRGPFKRGRIIDLSWGAAKKLRMMDTQKVHIYRCS
jgi:rare lipoprotein A